MRVVVTGAAGFVGSHLCEALLADGHQIVGIDAFTDGYPRAAKTANLTALAAERAFAFHAGDVRDPSSARHFEGVDAICHLAARPGIRDADEAAMSASNVTTTEHVMRLAARHGVRRVVLASSSSVYRPTLRRQREDRRLDPRSPYGRSKLRAEEVARSLGSQLGVEVVVVRYFTVYGPRQRPDMAFARFIAAARSGDSMPVFGTVARRRDFTFVSDAVAGTIAALHHGRDGAAYNISGGRSVRLGDAFAILSRLLGREPGSMEPRASVVAESHTTAADLAQARRQLGYRPRVGLTEGLAEQVAAASGAAAAA